MLTFSYKCLLYYNSPVNLKEKLKKNDSRNLNYILRNNNNFIEPMAKSKSGEKTFEHFYSRLINCFVIKRSMLKFSTFKLSIFNNINLIYTDFVSKFELFNLNSLLFKLL